MNKIEVEISNLEEYYKIKEQNILSYNLNKKLYMFNLFFLVIGMIFFLSAISSGYDVKEEMSKNSITKVTYHNYHFNLGIGIALIALFTLRFLEFEKTKKKIKGHLRTECKQISEKGAFIKFVLGEEKFEYLNNFKHIEIEWSYFKGFKVYNENIEFYVNNHYTNSPEYIIPIEEINKEKQELISDLLKRKLRRLK